MIKNTYVFAFAAMALCCIAPHGASQPASAHQPVLSVPIDPSVLVVPVTIKGKPYRFFLDTGASHTVIDNTLAATLTRPTPASQTPATLRRILDQGIETVDGQLNKDDIQLWQPETIALGTYDIAGSGPWLGHDMTAVSEALGERIDGILGIEAFRQLNWAISNVDKTLTVWRHAPSSLDYQHCMPYGDSFGKSPEMEVTFNNDWAMFRIDTGAVDTLVSDEFLRFLQAGGATTVQAGESMPSVSASGVGRSHSFLVDGLTFNQMAIGRLKVTRSNNLLSFGMNFMSRFDQYLLTPHSMQFCYNAANFTRDEQAAVRQIAVRHVQGSIEVALNDDAQIRQYGLQNGDRLLVIDGQAADPARIMEVRRRLMETPIGTLDVVIERDGRRIAMSV